MKRQPKALPKKSTVVRKFLESSYVTVLGRALGAIARLDPSAASRLAQKVYSTPPRLPTPDRELDVLASAHKFRFRSGKHELVAWSWGDGPTVFCLHGWGGRASQFHAFVEPLVAAGFSVVAVDAPAHGASPGKRASLADFANALEALVRWTGPAHAVIAHSMGAAAAVVALEKGVKIGRVVLIAPPADATRYLDAFAERLELSATVKHDLESRLARPLGVGWDELSLVDAAARMSVPGLIALDRQDAQVPFEQVKEIAQRWPGGETVVTEGLGHFRILRAAAVLEAVVEFVRRRPPHGLEPEGSQDDRIAM